MFLLVFIHSATVDSSEPIMGSMLYASFHVTIPAQIKIAMKSTSHHFDFAQSLSIEKKQTSDEIYQIHARARHGAHQEKAVW